MKPDIARGVRRLLPRRRRTRRRPDSTDGPVTTAAGWPPGATSDPYLEVDPTAQGGDDALADGDPYGRPHSARYRAAGSHADLREAFDPAEFAEFLEADDSPMPASPAFKERLRQKLWGMVRENADANAPPAPSRIGERTRRSGPNPKLPR